ncbi:Hypothetical protein ETEE_0924 [Edwardsiella anguillarum ET080813]|uniref:Uncharacterized protein n=1 Tax=Edwardsiella anguillarum ET080813 TaxID=667120 RepID=A0A076LH34_9GAMM|nr:Hypothetical protein ETEE_0924 [Edwardsiella anguillarum ET080813]
MTLVITDGEFWWTWRNLNKFLNILNIKDFSVFNFQLCT